jgi:hypothetical protein
MKRYSKLTTEYQSPDGLLKFIVVREGGDISLGFAGYPWHIHGNILASLSDLPTEEAISRYVDALLSNRTVIAIAAVDGVTVDVWITDNPPLTDRHKPQEEMITFRLWDVEPANGDS